jgi:hypothetical protein
LTPATRVLRAQEPLLATVVERARVYIAEYQRQLSGVVAEELYVQSVTLPPWSAKTRRLKSDVLIVRPPGADRYVLFRDVFDVDGRPVRDRQERLTGLFLKPSPSADAQVRQIITESARFNIGTITRTINVPTLALMVLDPEYQPRFAFTRTIERTPETISSGGSKEDPSIPKFSASVDVWVVEFREIASPTVIRTTADSDIPVRGRLWIEPSTGRVLMTEFIAEDPAILGVIDVSYEPEPMSGLLVPIAMRERYVGGGTTIEGYAVYSKLRRFKVGVEEKIQAPKP